MDQPKRLYRSTVHRMIAGIAGGLGEYFNLDPLVFRILFAALTIWGGAGLVLYIVMWMITPEAEQAAEKPNESAGPAGSSRSPAAAVFGIVLIVIGLSALGDTLLPWRIFRWDVWWPMVIIILGLLIIIRRT